MSDLGEGYDCKAQEALRVAMQSSSLKQVLLPGIFDAAKTVARLLDQAGIAYYFAGGFACIYGMGSRQLTTDLDVVVARDDFGTMFTVFESHPAIFYPGHHHFGEHPIIYTDVGDGFVEIDHLLEGWGGGNFPYVSESGFQRVGEHNFPCLPASFLLPAKLKCWGTATRSESKKANDTTDINAIVAYLKDKGEKVGIGKFSKDAMEGLQAWCEMHGKAGI